MSKRGRRASSSASHDADDGDDSDGQEPLNAPSHRKKKKADPGELCQQIYDTLRCHRKEDGTLLCDSFIRAPKRRQEPHYYEVVSQPIDLLRVQQKLKTDSYEDVDELSGDIELLVSNAKAFYKVDSVEYKDALTLWTVFMQTKNNLENSTPEELKTTSRMSRLASSGRKSTTSVDNADGELSEASTTNEDDEIFEELFVAIMSTTDGGRSLHSAFLDLPSKRQYPEYYEVIKQPIDMRMIAMKVQNCDYSTLADMEKDLFIMTKNACTFNEPGSQIYKDAKTLKKLIQAKKSELEHGKPQTPAKTSERIRSKRSPKQANLSLSSASVSAGAGSNADSDIEKNPEDSDDADDNDSAPKDSAQWKLYETIKNLSGPDGPMIEPFWRLPSKRFYPDYYKEIKNPISLSQINIKLRRGSYGTLSELAGDMNIMFENAKSYNTPSSRLYMDAAKMQKIMQQTVQEILDIVQDSSSDDESLSSMKSNNTTPVPRGRGRPRLTPNPSSGPASSGSGSSPVGQPLTLKKKMQLLERHLVEYTCSDGRQPLLLFMEKPSKKLYPDYYSVIEKPIDMLTIESNIKNDRYSNLDQIVADFRLMFSNCRQYNEEGSMIYEDANLLEKALNEKLKELNADRKTPVRPANKTPKVKQLSPIEQKLRTLYDAIRDYREPKLNRQLALIFMKLPTKSEYPDYYELIKNPIDMERIAQKLKTNCYSSVTELASDFVLMFDNACKYNEPDSQIYKDALVLQRICLQTKQMLREDEETIPDVSAAVQEILMSLFTMVYNHQDEEGRCFSDSMAELPEHDEVDGIRMRAVSLDLIKRRLDKGLYKRLDHFQEDMFTVFERARNLSRVDSQVFEDSVELQMYYIKCRDQLCKEGTVLYSPAMKVTQADLAASIELIKQCNLIEEHPEEDNEARSNSDDTTTLPAGGQPLTEAQYNKGDFVYYIQNNKKEPSILQVERVWTNAENVPSMYGNCYFRPHDTFHVATRRFLEQEVFKTDSHQGIPLEQVVGKCCVLNVKDYFKFKPEGFADKDVYVCESRYSTRTRSFKKIKAWPTVSDSPHTLVLREQALEPKRVMSVFRERVEKHKDELAELEVLENVQEKERPNVVVFNPLGGDDENTYFEQYNTVCSGVIKTGDYVYVVTDGGKQMVAQVDTMWETKDEKCYFRGPWLIQPSEVIGTVNKVFYKQEVLLTAVYDSSPMIGIVGKCAVLHYEEYLKCRPTEIVEADVYVCEALYDESNRTSRKLKTGLRKYEHTDVVTPDEIYFFPRSLGPPPLANVADLAATPQIIRPSNSQVEIQPNFYCNETLHPDDVEILLESSLDESSMASPGTPISIGGGTVGSPANNPISNVVTLTGAGISSGAPSPAVPASTSKKKKKQQQSLQPGEKKLNDKKFTGYILYSREVRKSIIANNPVSTFGEISRLVGNEWRQLTTSNKQMWEEKAARLNEEAAKVIAEGGIPVLPFSAQSLQQPTDKVPKGDTVYECLWDTCDYQFEDFADCSDHVIGEAGGHVQQLNNNNGVLQCLWRGCNRQKRQATASTPFPNLARLTRHVRDQHINKGNGRNVPPPDRSKNFQVSRNKSKPSVIQHRPQAQAGASAGGAASGLVSQGSLAQGVTSTMPGLQISRPVAPEPLFVSVPPRPHRVQHSEAYIRYIEGLHSEQKYISPWEKNFTPLPSNLVDSTNTNSAKTLCSWFSEDIISSLNTTQTSDENAPANANTNGQAATAEPHQNPTVLKALWGLRDLLLKDAIALTKNL